MRLKIQNPYSKVPQSPYFEKSVGDPKKRTPNFVENQTSESTKVVGLSIPFQHVWTVVKGGDL